jgi:hypothetical protein
MGPLRDARLLLTVAAVLVSVGTGLLAAPTSVTSLAHHARKRGGPRTRHKHGQNGADRRKVRGPKGKPGARGPQGLAGPQGPAGAPGAAGSARAYGLVSGRAIPVANVGTSPYLHNVVIQGGVAGSSPGTYCLALTNGLSSAAAIVIVGPAELPTDASPPPGTEIVVPYAAWLSGAPDCASAQLEIRTFVYTITAGSLALSPSDYVSFSFIIP